MKLPCAFSQLPCAALQTRRRPLALDRLHYASLILQILLGSATRTDVSLTSPAEQHPAKPQRLLVQTGLLKQRAPLVGAEAPAAAPMKAPPSGIVQATTPMPVAEEDIYEHDEPDLQNLGDSGCSPKKKCKKCQGDCDTDKDCAEGLKCFHKSTNGEWMVPGCSVGGPGDKPSLDYCYKAPETFSWNPVPEDDLGIHDDGSMHGYQAGHYGADSMQAGPSPSAFGYDEYGDQAHSAAEQAAWEAQQYGDMPFEDHHGEPWQTEQERLADGLATFNEDRQLATAYVFSSCQQMPRDAKSSYALTLGMSVSKCFHHCSARQGTKYFGITRGHECFCSPLVLGHVVPTDKCDVKCSGNPTQFCGGVSNLASVYTMINCAPKSQHELDKAAEAKIAKLVASYHIVDDESCGQGKEGLTELDGSNVMPGEPRDCAVACWEAKGAEYCQGFTYDAMMERCTFHADVVEGKVVKKKGMKCYYKKLQADL